MCMTVENSCTFAAFCNMKNSNMPLIMMFYFFNSSRSLAESLTRVKADSLEVPSTQDCFFSMSLKMVSRS